MLACLALFSNSRENDNKEISFLSVLDKCGFLGREGGLRGLQWGFQGRQGGVGLSQLRTIAVFWALWGFFLAEIGPNLGRIYVEKALC
jgi:hypothetical protein